MLAVKRLAEMQRGSEGQGSFKKKPPPITQQQEVMMTTFQDSELSTELQSALIQPGPEAKTQRCRTLSKEHDDVPQGGGGGGGGGGPPKKEARTMRQQSSQGSTTSTTSSSSSSASAHRGSVSSQGKPRHSHAHSQPAPPYTPPHTPTKTRTSSSSSSSTSSSSVQSAAATASASPQAPKPKTAGAQLVQGPLSPRAHHPQSPPTQRGPPNTQPHPQANAQHPQANAHHPHPQANAHHHPHPQANAHHPQTNAQHAQANAHHHPQANTHQHPQTNAHHHPHPQANTHQHPSQAPSAHPQANAQHPQTNAQHPHPQANAHHHPQANAHHHPQHPEARPEVPQNQVAVPVLCLPPEAEQDDGDGGEGGNGEPSALQKKRAHSLNRYAVSDGECDERVGGGGGGGGGGKGGSGGLEAPGGQGSGGSSSGGGGGGGRKYATVTHRVSRSHSVRNQEKNVNRSQSQSFALRQKKKGPPPPPPKRSSSAISTSSSNLTEARPTHATTGGMLDVPQLQQRRASDLGVSVETNSMGSVRSIAAMLEMSSIGGGAKGMALQRNFLQVAVPGGKTRDVIGLDGEVVNRRRTISGPVSELVAAARRDQPMGLSLAPAPAQTPALEHQDGCPHVTQPVAQPPPTATTSTTPSSTSSSTSSSPQPPSSPHPGSNFEGELDASGESTETTSGSPSGIEAQPGDGEGGGGDGGGGLHGDGEGGLHGDVGDSGIYTQEELSRADATATMKRRTRGSKPGGGTGSGVGGTGSGGGGSVGGDPNGSRFTLQESSTVKRRPKSRDKEPEGFSADLARTNGGGGGGGPVTTQASVPQAKDAVQEQQANSHVAAGAPASALPPYQNGTGTIRRRPVAPAGDPGGAVVVTEQQPLPQTQLVAHVSAHAHAPCPVPPLPLAPPPAERARTRARPRGPWPGSPSP
ncbi:hypothetical protein CRUP_035208, partial [Coryphaenoides rupestris]